MIVFIRVLSGTPPLDSSEGPIVVLQPRRPLAGAEGPVRGILHDFLRKAYKVGPPSYKLAYKPH